MGEFDGEGIPRIQRCDECERYASDDEAARNRAAVRALTREVCGRVRSRAARAALMREHALRVAAADALAWLGSSGARDTASVLGARERLEEALEI